MRRLLMPIIALAALIGFALPAHANHGNWEPPPWADVLENRNLSYASYSAWWCFFTDGTQDVYRFMGLNETGSGHYYRVFVHVRYPDTEIADSGYKNLWASAGNAWAWQGLSIVSPPRDRDRETYAIIKTSDGNTSYLDPFQLNSGETQNIYPVGTWSC